MTLIYSQAILHKINLQLTTAAAAAKQFNKFYLTVTIVIMNLL